MSFHRALTAVLDLEGDYSDDARDPGGRTRYGITEAVAREQGYQGDMQDLPKSLAESIYKTHYWDVCHCDDLPWPLSAYVFDAAVNQGGLPARRMLQRALHTLEDGNIGPLTLRLAAKSTPWHAARFMAFRALRYTATSGFDVYGMGWMTRLFLLRVSTLP